jgi:solute carrier family 25 (mitochondrial folate transporter), member 32
MSSAVAAGAVTASLTSPLWVVKTRFQTHSTPSPIHGVSVVTSGGVFSSILQMARREGVSSLYKGLGVSLIGLVHVAIQFPLYERFKQSLAEPSGSLSVWSLILASASSKTIAVSVSYPHEVVRSRQQHATERLRAGDTVRHVWRSSGWRGFYDGMGTNLLRTVPSCIITFVTYEVVVRRLSQWAQSTDLD